MRRIVCFAVSLIWMLSLHSAKAETFFAACAWNKASPIVHKELLIEFNKSPHEGEALLYKYEDQLRSLSALCSGRTNISEHFVMGSIFYQAAMEATAAELKASLGIDQAKLDLAWEKEAGASICLLAETAKDNPYIIIGPPCDDPNVLLQFLRRFKISRKKDPLNASRLVGYFVAKAQAKVDQMAFEAESTRRDAAKPHDSTP